MINITDLDYTSPSTAPPGALLIHAAKAPSYAAWLAIGGGGPRNSLTIDNGPRGFKVMNGQGAHGPFLLVANPRFVVDPRSALNGFDSSPEPGTLFITPNGPGILARTDHSELGVMLDGTLLADIDYGAFAGFRHWRIEVGDPNGESDVLFTYRHPSLDEAA
ncbi:hypothetical protein [Sphingomonas psychrotolerans]|uniref:Uncharacterized protein n=1 Tax=Sphingomonas psychrotolerans TaxID=1327635 RepID=A0A2K8MDH7_9SPHN|nr:hypothetical protein [Sphingomonas psychrotolerans]ATY30606.1 hypothetical protein CVN68_00170 [Sphingomonas psychrotolerans]